MGKKGTKRKTRWRVLPIGEDGGSGSGNEDDVGVGAASTEGDVDHHQQHHLGGTYARATQHQRGGGVRRPNTTNNNNATGRTGSYYNKQPYHPRSYNNHDTAQPLVTTEKQIFNEEEYTKITTPRQDVLFKKGYLGRKKPVVAAEQDATTTPSAGTNGHYNSDGTYREEILETDPHEMMEEQPQFIYTNGFVDQTGVYYINGSGYEMYDPYSGNITVIVGPHYPPNGGPPVLAAMPCQPLPLQPLEWFNPPGFLPYVTAPCHNGLPRDRRKRYSTDSQNCSPQSSESTGPPGSPQESDEIGAPVHGGGDPTTAHTDCTMYPPQPPAYVYPGFMFGAPMYNMNGVTVQSAPNQAPSSDVQGKRRKKKRKRRRKNNGAEDGSEESSSDADDKDVDDKDVDDDHLSPASQESSLESDSKHSLSSVSDHPPANPSSRPSVLQTPVLPQPAPVSKLPVHDEPKPVKELPAIQAKVTPTNGNASVNGIDHYVKVNNCVNTQAKLQVSNVKVVLDELPKVNGNKEVSKAPVILNGDIKLTNGKKGKKSPVICNGNGFHTDAPVVVKESVVAPKEVDVAFERYEDFGAHNGSRNEVAVEEEWITVKPKGSQAGKKVEAVNGNGGRFYEERRFVSELTNGHAKPYKEYKKEEPSRVNGVKSQKSVEKLLKVNGKAEEKCLSVRVKPAETASKEKLVNGRSKGKALSTNKMEGNEKDDFARERGLKSARNAEEKTMSSSSSSEDSKNSSSSPADEAPAKPSRRERKFLKNASPPKTPDVVVMTATATPFAMPSVSLRPDASVKPSESSALPERSQEDSLLAALAVGSSNHSAPTETLASHESKIDAKPNPVPTTSLPAVKSLKDLSIKSIPQDISVAAENRTMDISAVTNPIVTVSGQSAKDSSAEFLVKEMEQLQPLIDLVKTIESNGDSGDQISERPLVNDDPDSDSDLPPPVAPPRRKKTWRPANKRVATERAPTPGKTTDSTEESSSSSSQESEESVIECLSSGINSPEVKNVSSFSSDDEEVIYTGKLGVSDPEVAGTLKPSKETSEKNAANDVVLKRPDTLHVQLLVEDVVPEVTEDTRDVSEEHLKQVREAAEEFVDSIIDEASAEVAKTEQTHEETELSKLGITDAVTRWLRSQSPDVLSVPNEDALSELSDEFEADADDEIDTGSKNLHRNPLRVPSVKNSDNNSGACSSANYDGASRRVAKTLAKSNERKHSNDDEEDEERRSTDSIPCGEWDLWDCHHAISTPTDDTKVPEIRRRNSEKQLDHILCHAPIASSGTGHPLPVTPEYIHLPDGERFKYDPMANDTFSSLEGTLLERVDSPTPNRCANMCDPNVSVAKYYILGPRPEKTNSPVQDVECSGSESSTPGMVGYVNGTECSLAEELAKLEQPLPRSWAVAPLTVGDTASCQCKCRCKEEVSLVDSGVESGDEAAAPRKVTRSVFKRRLVGRLTGEGAPFPCGGVCCIVQ